MGIALGKVELLKLISEALQIDRGRHKEFYSFKTNTAEAQDGRGVTLKMQVPLGPNLELILLSVQLDAKPCVAGTLLT